MVFGGRRVATASASSFRGSQGTASEGTAASFQKYLTNCRSFYSCIYCRTHLANHDELISRSFQGNRSRAYLFNSIINITTGPAVQRELNTGSHAVADIFCSNCGTTIGWKYEKAYVESQKYKEGKFIIELAHVVRENRHLELDKRDMFLGALMKESLLVSDHNKRPAEQHGWRCSLSPPSMGWSSYSSSSSGSSPSSSISLAKPQPVKGDRMSPEPGAVARRQRRRTGCALDGSEEDEEMEEEEEVLMFPFHDDLYGERASYSNLSNSRLSFGRRARRSLHLDSVPYDWKYSARSQAISSCRARRSEPDEVAQEASRRNATPSASSSGQCLSQSSEGPLGRRSRTASETQFVIDQLHCNYDKNEADEEQNHHSNLSEKNDDEILERDATTDHRVGGEPRPSTSKECDLKLAALEGAAIGNIARNNDNKNNVITGDKISGANTVSLDDEEFYDCCTDHNVSTSAPIMGGSE